MISERQAVNEFMSKEDKYSEALARVTTVSELAIMYKKPESSIRNDLRMGYIYATQSGSTWLISLDSAIDWYGHKPDLSNIA